MNALGRGGLAAALFLSSAAGLVLEIVAARLIAPYVGMSLYTWTAIIAAVLAGMSAGHWIGGRLAGASDSRVLARVAVLFAFSALNVLVVPVLLRWTAPHILGDPGNILLAVSILTAVLFFLPSLLIAAASPMLTRVAIDAEPDNRGIVLGRMFALGAGGAILGTLAAGFLFISWIGSQGTLMAVAGVMGLMAAAFGLWARRQNIGPAAALLGLLVAVAGVTGHKHLMAKFCTIESDYYCIRVIDFSRETGRDSKLMVLDHMGHGINDRLDPLLIHSSYVELTDVIVRERFQGRRDVSSYFIGGGAYTLPRAWAARFPDGRHTVAEIDPEVTRAAREQMWYEDVPTVAIRHADARMLLQSLPATPQFDAVVGDAYHDFSVPHHLVTLEFAREVRSRMTPDGVFAMTVIDGRKEPKLLLAMLKTMHEVFPAVEIWADAAQASSSKRLTYLLVASGHPVPHGRLSSLGGTGKSWVRLSPGAVAGRLGPDDLPVLTDDFAPVDRLLGAIVASED